MQNSNYVQKSEKMHRVNRILMIIISLLLALVLITTCVLSGVYAKYITKKSIGTTITFKKNGVKVDIDVSEDLKTVSTVEGEDTINIIISDLYMRPGYDFADALKLTVNGSPISSVTFVVDIEVAYKDSSFTLPAGKFNGFDADTVCMPIGFKVGTYNESDVYTSDYAVEPYSLKTGAEIEADIESKIAELTDLTCSDNAARKTCAIDQKITFGSGITAVGLGFDWPEAYGDTPEEIALNDRIGTWISNQIPAHTFDIIVTIGIE